MSGSHRDRTHPLAQCLIDDRRGRFLNQFLVATLDGAFTLTQVDRVTVAIAEHLYFDVAHVFKILLEVDHARAERADCASLLSRAPPPQVLPSSVPRSFPCRRHPLTLLLTRDIRSALLRPSPFQGRRRQRRCPGTVGTPAACAVWLAVSLSPSRRIASGVIHPHQAGIYTAWAKSAFSARKP